MAWFLFAKLILVKAENMRKTTAAKRLVHFTDHTPETSVLKQHSFNIDRCIIANSIKMLLIMKTDMYSNILLRARSFLRYNDTKTKQFGFFCKRISNKILP